MDEETFTLKYLRTPTRTKAHGPFLLSTICQSIERLHIRDIIDDTSIRQRESMTDLGSTMRPLTTAKRE